MIHNCNCLSCYTLNSCPVQAEACPFSVCVANKGDSNKGIKTSLNFLLGLDTFQDFSSVSPSVFVSFPVVLCPKTITGQAR